MFKKEVLATILFLSYVSVLCADNAIQGDDGYKKGKVANQTFSVQVEDIFCEDNDIWVQVEGQIYLVKSLEKMGVRWLAKVENSVGFCGEGHEVCPDCYQCHVQDCFFAVFPACWSNR